VHSIVENWKRYFLLQNSLDTAHRRGYPLLVDDKQELAILDLYKVLGKPWQGARVLKLYRVFESLLTEAEDRPGQIVKAICAG